MKHLIEIETDSGPNGDREKELKAIQAVLDGFIGYDQRDGGPRKRVAVTSVREMHELGY